MAMTEQIQVEVVYALPDRQQLVQLAVAVGCTAEQAVMASGVPALFGLGEEGLQLGIFGKAVPASQVLRAGDRVEIYRPLLADPKEVRRRRAAAGKRK